LQSKSTAEIDFLADPKVTAKIILFYDARCVARWQHAPNRGNAIQMTRRDETRITARRPTWGSQLKRDNQINGTIDLAFQSPAKTMRCKNITNKFCSGEFSNDRELPYYKKAPRK